MDYIEHQFKEIENLMDKHDKTLKEVFRKSFILTL